MAGAVLGVGDHQAAAPDLKRIGAEVEPRLQRVVHALDRGHVGAAGVGISNKPGVRTNANGYTVVPQALPYRSNRVSLDTQSMPADVDIAEPVREVTPNRGAFVLADFDTRRGKRILLLGAGGAVRGALEPLLAEQPASVIIANRTVEKAELLCELFTDLGPVSASGFGWLREPVDLIINATSASLSGDVPPIAGSLIEPGKTLCYDMMYGKEPTAFCRWASEHGAAVAMDGLGMLAEQAAEAFFLWRGVRPDTAPVLAELRRQLAQ